MNEPTDGDSESRVPDCSADKAAPESLSAIAQTARRLIRSGWWIFVVGLPVTLFGSYLIAAGGKLPSPFAESVHKVGLLILLVGLVMALVGYRFPWLVNFALTEFPPPYVRPPHVPPRYVPRSRRGRMD